MKKIITLSLLGIFSLGMNAQTTIADFESDIDTSVLTIIGADETQQSIFELYAENPDKTGLNTTDKCLYIKSNQEYYDDYTNSDGRPTWNGNVFYITFEEAVTIDDTNKYLHIMHMKGAIMNNWLIYGENGDGTYVEFGRGTTAEANVWYDIVVDMSAKLSTVKSIRVHLDGNWLTDPVLRFYEPTDFYYDEIIMNDDATARTTEGEVVEPILPVTDQSILDFENEEVTSSRITMNVQSTSYLIDLYAENPDKEGANTSDRCASFCNPATYNWWHGFYFTFNQTVETTGYKYLHMMMKKDVEETSNVVINLVNEAGSQSSASATDATTIYTPVTTEWVDYVMVIPSGWETVYGIYVKWNAAVNTNCYFDQLYMDNDPSPRTSLAGVDGIEASTIAKSVVCVNGKTITTTTASQSMQVYNLLGGLVYEGEGSYEAKTAGIYVVKVNGTVQKVAVK